jgi:hypothetical protein
MSSFSIQDTGYNRRTQASLLDLILSIDDTSSGNTIYTADDQLDGDRVVSGSTNTASLKFTGLTDFEASGSGDVVVTAGDAVNITGGNNGVIITSTSYNIELAAASNCIVSAIGDVYIQSRSATNLAYKWPSDDATGDQMLTTSAAGNMSWEYPGNTRVFAESSDVTVATPSEPTVTEIKTWDTAFGPYVDRLIYYTGTDTSSDTSLYVWNVDSGGTYTLLYPTVPVVNAGASNYIKIGTVTIQWGEVANDDGEVIVTLPTAFGDTNYSVSGTFYKEAGWSAPSAVGVPIAIVAGSITTTTYTVDRDNDIDSGLWRWIAIGLSA